MFDLIIEFLDEPMETAAPTVGDARINWPRQESPTGPPADGVDDNTGEPELTDREFIYI